MGNEIILKRLKKSIAYLKGREIITKQQDIVDAMGYNKGSVSQALSNKNGYLTEEFVKKFANTFNLNHVWLLTGEGEMLNSTNGNVVNEERASYGNIKELSPKHIDEMTKIIYENREQFLEHPLFKQIIKTEIARLEVKKAEERSESIYDDIKKQLMNRIKPTKG